MYTYAWFMLKYSRNQTQYCKAIIFPLKINKLKKKNLIVQDTVLIGVTQNMDSDYRLHSA